MNRDHRHGDNIHGLSTTSNMPTIKPIAHARQQTCLQQSKTIGISHATPTHRGRPTAAGYQQSGVTQATFPTWCIRNNARPITKLTAACNNDNLIYVKCTDDLIRSGRSVNAKFALINVRSVRNKADLIKEHIVEQNYDIVALTETWLTKYDQAEINVLMW